jgi:hypothetical protein
MRCLAGMSHFIEIHHLIKTDEQSTKASEPNKEAQELDLIIDIRISDDGTDAQCLFGVCLGRKLSTQPAKGIRFERFISSIVPSPILCNDFGKVISTD